jgi:nitrite reductase (NO-forming)
MARSGADRRLTALSISVALVFVGSSLASLALPPAMRLGTWLPLHLMLAGGAATAISGVMPFFSAALASTAPAPWLLRAGGVAGIVGGALMVTLGRLASPALTGPDALVTGAGALVYICGLTLVGAATLLPLRRALGERRLVVGAIYGVALADVLAGASLAALLLFNVHNAAASWPALKPAHAWLNLFGFVSLTVAGSLLHLLPTVVGARIARTTAATATYAALIAGPPLAATGFILGVTLLALTGAVIVAGGSVALAVFVVTTFRVRAAWTTDAGWHRLTSWSLVAGVGWFVAATFIAAGTVAAGGADAAGWRLELVVLPLVVGWVGQVLLGAASHLLPAVGPGSPERHARQRRILGTGSTARLVALNTGIAVAAVGLATGATEWTLWAFVVVALSAVATLALLAAAVLAPEVRAARLMP